MSWINEKVESLEDLLEAKNRRIEMLEEKSKAIYNLLFAIKNQSLSSTDFSDAVETCIDAFEVADRRLAL